jgi:hypothetical protein
MAGHDLITGVGIEGDLGTVTGVDDTGRAGRLGFRRPVAPREAGEMSVARQC